MNDLYEDLRDGHNLISLLEVLSGDTLVRGHLLLGARWAVPLFPPKPQRKQLKLLHRGPQRRVTALPPSFCRPCLLLAGCSAPLPRLHAACTRVSPGLSRESKQQLPSYLTFAWPARGFGEGLDSPGAGHLGPTPWEPTPAPAVLWPKKQQEGDVSSTASMSAACTDTDTGSAPAGSVQEEERQPAFGTRKGDLWRSRALSGLLS